MVDATSVSSISSFLDSFGPSFELLGGFTCYCTPPEATESSSTTTDLRVPGEPPLPPNHNLDNGRFNFKWLQDPTMTIKEQIYMGTWDVEPNKKRLGLVLYCHEDESHIHEENTETELLWNLADAGFVVVAVDRPGSGRTAQHPENIVVAAEKEKAEGIEEGTDSETTEEEDIGLEVAVLAMKDARETFKNIKKNKPLKTFVMGHSGTEQKGFWIASMPEPSSSEEIKACIQSVFLPVSERGEFDGGPTDVVDGLRQYLIDSTRKPSAFRRASLALRGSKSVSRGSIV